MAVTQYHPVQKYEYTIWAETFGTLSRQKWTNDPEQPANSYGMWFDDRYSDNVARAWKIDGLGPVLRSTSNEAIHILKDKKGYWYVWHAHDLRLFAFPEKMTEYDVFDQACAGILPYHDAERGWLIDCADDGKTWPGKL